MNKKAIVPLLIFLVMAGLFLLMLSRMNEGEYNPRDIPTEFIGRAAPEFALPDLYNPTSMVKPSDYKGKTWLLNVWGTWCPECWKEHEFLLKLKRRGVTIVSINWRDDADEAKAMLARLGNPFTQVASDPHSSAVIDYGVYGAPETFLIDAEGIIRAKHKGGMHEAVWQDKFVPLLGSGS